MSDRERVAGVLLRYGVAGLAHAARRSDGHAQHLRVPPRIDRCFSSGTVVLPRACGREGAGGGRRGEGRVYHCRSEGWRRHSMCHRSPPRQKQRDTPPRPPPTLPKGSIDEACHVREDAFSRTVSFGRNQFSIPIAIPAKISCSKKVCAERSTRSVIDVLVSISEPIFVPRHREGMHKTRPAEWPRRAKCCMTSCQLFFPRFAPRAARLQKLATRLLRLLNS